MSPCLPEKSFDYGADEEESEDEGMFGVAHSLSDLLIKCQDDEDEDFVYYPEVTNQERQSEQTIQMPVYLVSNLQHMVEDYYCRFPPSEPASSVPQTPITHPSLLIRSSPPVTPVPAATQHEDQEAHTTDEEREISQ